MRRVLKTQALPSPRTAPGERFTRHLCFVYFLRCWQTVRVISDFGRRCAKRIVEMPMDFHTALCCALLRFQSPEAPILWLSSFCLAPGRD